MSELHLRLTEFSGSSRMDRITDVVLDLLFELTQQTARFAVGVDPWRSLAVYDADGFAPFMGGGRA